MNLIFKAVVGSQAYGTSIPTSDIDYKGIFACEYQDLLGFNYKEQIEVSKDETIYEIKRFLQLAQSANPTMLELLYTPLDCVVHASKAATKLLFHREMFLTTACANSFGGYAIAQIKKAGGLNKKMNYEKSRIERKTPLDFCYTLATDVYTEPLLSLLDKNDISQENCALVKLDHFPNCYALYHHYDNGYDFSGLIGPDSNEIRTCSVPNHLSPIAILHFNKDGYSMHCKDYKEYQTWLETRNTQRYVGTVEHGQQIDGKNLMHCRRLLDMAIEIATEGTINVRRPNAAELLKIRRGEVRLDELIEKAEEDIANLDSLFAKSGLPKEVDKTKVNDLLLEIREITLA